MSFISEHPNKCSHFISNKKKKRAVAENPTLVPGTHMVAHSHL